MRTAQRASELDERLEYRLLLVRWNSRPGISDVDRCGLLLGRAPYRHRSTGLRELHGVGEKIQQDLIDLGAIGHRNAFAAGRVDDKHHALRFCLGLDQRHH